jgi:hypothetical protein
MDTASDTSSYLRLADPKHGPITRKGLRGHEQTEIR